MFRSERQQARRVAKHLQQLSALTDGDRIKHNASCFFVSNLLTARRICYLALDRTKPGTFSVLAVGNQDTPPTPGLPAANFVQLQSLLGTGFFATAPAAAYSVSLNMTFFTQDLGIIDSDALPTDLTLFPSFLLSLSILDPVSRDVMDFQANVALRRFVPPSAVAEPGSLAVFGLGLAALLYSIQARRSA